MGRQQNSLSPSLPICEHSALGLNPYKLFLGLKYYRVRLRTAAVIKSVLPCPCPGLCRDRAQGWRSHAEAALLGWGVGELAPPSVPTVGVGWGPRGWQRLGLPHGPAIQQGWFWAHTPTTACSTIPLRLDPSPPAQLLLL